MTTTSTMRETISSLTDAQLASLYRVTHGMTQSELLPARPVMIASLASHYRRSLPAAVTALTETNIAVISAII